MNKKLINNALVIGAHFDDAELGCGGTMAKLSAQGVNVYKLTLTDNETHFKEKNIEIDASESARFSAKACEILGVTEITDFPFVACNQLSYSTEIMQQVERIIFEKQIDTVFIHFNEDVNQDHVAASRICKTAARYCRNILYYQSNGYVIDKPFYPSVFVDISDYHEKKRQALCQYRGDHNRFNRLFDVAFHKDAIWGYGNQTQYAEGFIPVKLCLEIG